MFDCNRLQDNNRSAKNTFTTPNFLQTCVLISCTHFFPNYYTCLVCTYKATSHTERHGMRAKRQKAQMMTMKKDKTLLQ